MAGPRESQPTFHHGRFPVATATDLIALTMAGPRESQPTVIARTFFGGIMQHGIRMK